MKAFLESFSLGSGALLIAVLSTGVVLLLGSRLPKNLHLLSAVVVPFVLAYCLYWSPVWFGSYSDEYDAWSILGVGAWFLAGSFPSAAMVLIIQKRRARMSSEK
jgi:peptidoglycan/LPS O-acetylase OafA/YrhL